MTDTLPARLRGLYAAVTSHIGGPHPGDDLDYVLGKNAGCELATDDLSAAGFTEGASIAADEIDRLSAELAAARVLIEESELAVDTTLQMVENRNGGLPNWDWLRDLRTRLRAALNPGEKE